MSRRNIEVTILGDASDLERSLAGALAGLKAFGAGADRTGKKTSGLTKAWRDSETGLFKFDRAAKQAEKTLSGGPFGLIGLLGKGAGMAFKLGGAVASSVQTLATFGQATAGAAVATEQLTGIAAQAVVTVEEMGGAAAQTEGAMASFAGTLAAAANPIGLVVAGVGLVVGALLVVPAAAGAASAALTALLSVVATGVAVFAGFVAPVTLVTGLLGGLGAAFAYVAVQSFKNKASLQDQHDALLKLQVAQTTYTTAVQKYTASSTQAKSALIGLHKAQDDYAKAQQGVALGALNLDDKFHSLVQTLSKDFAPEILSLGKSAATALTYLGNIAKLPLDQAFKNLATHGVRLFSKFLYGVGHALAKPFRLAVQIAFGQTGSTMQKSVQSWWDSFTHYLFGYTKTRKLHLGFHTLVTKTQVDGALQPIMDWFGRQHFEKTGLEWANKVMSALKSSGLGQKIIDFIGPIASAAGSAAGKAFVSTFEAELVSLPFAIGAALSGIQGPALTVDKHGGVHNPQGIPTGPIGRGGGAGGGVHHHAFGGMAYPGQVSLVGERGPELRVEGSTARYIPAAQTRQMLGGGDHLHIHIEGGTFIGAPTRQAAEKWADAIGPIIARRTTRR